MPLETSVGYRNINVRLDGAEAGDPDVAGTPPTARAALI
jgi:hypothetical protein